MNETEAFEGVNEVPFDIDWEEKKVWTRCGDPDYDYTISFDSIKKLYELIVSKDIDKK